MTPDAFASEIGAALAPHANAERALAMRAYMRHQFEFIGVPTPLRRQAVLPVLKALQVQNADYLLACAHVLWTMPAREYQYVATDLLARKWKTLALGDIARLLTIAQHASWWDSVDPLAAVVGDVLKAARVEALQAQAAMDTALRHESLWVRRIAMIHQLGWREHTDEDRLFAYARALAAESDFFIRKAIGWALRDYARHAPDVVSGFLSTSRDLISPLTLREASKHLPPIC
ncbi:DNA alkylation repair enzyme family protein [Paraburkholderia xenovorans LB400]|uniref:DNA-7-methylguanine glycosylase n=1 Tax=Paraburkholderia xenovorans (strain LB400) TaxID=266265 RepID=Q13SF5_PARXL|nr:DNA alkylation repair protein [Paraburkholderia xenovorans]ABE32984.1 DNA-7-methylguanine glycosylase [Paraburkholderia xenovorans LB400]AIP37641.1 DNA alkylation repair enzyme family protein [Paraburkholderia xenovorans LB400]